MIIDKIIFTLIAFIITVEISYALYKYVWKFFVFEMITHFRAYSIFTSLILILLGIFFSSIGLITGIISLILSARFFKYQKKSASQYNLSLLTANILYHNHNPEKLLELIEKNSPDIIALQELHTDFANKLEQLKTQYPYNLLSGKQDGSGIGLLSKIPLEDIKEVCIAPDSKYKWPSIAATISIDGKKTTIITTHIPPPHIDLKERQYHLCYIINYIASLPTTLILCGDFNLTPYSPDFWNFVKKTNLSFIKNKTAYLNSWPNTLPEIFRIPIDHVFISPNITQTEVKILPDIHSDHLPILAKFRI